MSFHRAPLGLKARPPSKAFGKLHMAKVARLPCMICFNPQVEVHHCISERFSQRKAWDTETIPLCVNHHRGPDGIHTNKAAWEEKYGLDKDYLPVVADMIAGELTE
jgi:hypothetical protein